MQFLLTDLKMAPQDWSTVVPLITFISNGVPLQRLGSRQPGIFRTLLEIMTGIQLHCNALVSGFQDSTTMQLDCIRVKQFVSIARLQTAEHQMHKNMVERVSKELQKQIQVQN